MPQENDTLITLLPAISEMIQESTEANMRSIAIVREARADIAEANKIVVDAITALEQAHANGSHAIRETPLPDGHAEQFELARKPLREKQEALKAAKAAHQDAEQVAARASEDLQRATDALKAFDGLDEAFAQARITALRTGSWNGYGPELEARRQAKAEAEQDLRHSKRAHAVLAAAEEEARLNVTLAEREVEDASAVIFCQNLKLVVYQIASARKWFDYYQRVLRGACVPFGVPGHWERLRPDQRTAIMATSLRAAGLPVGTLSAWREMDAAASSAIYEPLDRTTDVDPAMREHWHQFAKALASDPYTVAVPFPE